MPVSQVLTVDGIDPELLPTTKDSIAEGFKQAASGRSYIACIKIRRLELRSFLTG